MAQTAAERLKAMIQAKGGGGAQQLPPAATAAAATPAPVTKQEPPVLVETTTTSLAPIATGALPTLVQDDAAANDALALLIGSVPSVDDGITAAVEAADGGGGMSFPYPFARVKKGNWDVLKDAVDAAIYDFMPAGQRSFSMVYLGHRIAATGWRGQFGDTQGPPLFKYAIPAARFCKISQELIRATMHVGSRVQYTPSADRLKFDVVGRLTPEIHVFGWTQQTGLLALVVTGFNSAETTNISFGETQLKIGVPYKFSIEKEEVINKKAAPGAKNARWDTFSLKAVTIPADAGLGELHKAFVETRARTPQLIANGALGFMQATDFGGLGVNQIIDKLESYSSVLECPVLNEKILTEYLEAEAAKQQLAAPAVTA